MKISTARARRASITSHTMQRAYRLAAMLALLAGCAEAPQAPAPQEDRMAPERTATPNGLPAVAALATAPPGPSTPSPATTPSIPAAAPPAPMPPGTLLRPASRWIPVSWSELPGWDADRAGEAWSALLRGCEKPAPGWVRACGEAARLSPRDESAVRSWIAAQLMPYRIESLDGQPEGLATGYFEPLVDASRAPRGPFKVPLHGPPADLATRKPWFSRAQLDDPQARAALRGREVGWVADPLDALLLQVQGSGRVRFVEPDGRAAGPVRLAFAGHNDQPYKSVGRWLIEQGELRPDRASWPAIREWARRNPSRVNELLASNPRLVFFREEPIADASLGPRGAQGVPLTAERSIAVDPRSVPYGTPVWLDTTDPQSRAPLRRLVMAQDTGGAIVGAVRADYFWGSGERAEAQAGRMKQPLRMWALWPRRSD